MSSTTERQRGQILIIFAGGLVAFLAIAALVFDVGQNLLDWRAQRNAADAAALAGSRFIAEPECYANPSLGTCPNAVTAALQLAAGNGYGDTNGDGTDERGHVTVLIPPQHGDSIYRQKGFIEVSIHTDRPSFFAAVLGVLQQNVDAFAVAGNSSDIAPPYSMLALRTDCVSGVEVGGGGTVTVEGGSVVSNSNSDCGQESIWSHGEGSLSAPECDAVGTIGTDGRPADMNCTKEIEGFSGTGDPLAGLAPPSDAKYPPDNVQVVSWDRGTPFIPGGCPGSTISFMDAYADGGMSLSGLPPFDPYDIAIVFAYNAVDSTIPGPAPAGWNSSDTLTRSVTGANANAARIGWRLLQAGDWSGGTWTTGVWPNATALEVIILAGNDPGAPIGQIGFYLGANADTTTLTTPQLNNLQSAGTSWVVAFAGSKGSDANAAGVSDATTRSLAAVGGLALHTGERTSSWAQRDYSSAVDVPGNITAAIEIKAGPVPATALDPGIGCSFNHAGAVYRIHPGVYYGGIHLTAGVTVYMAPGTYWLAGGGLSVISSQLVSVTGPNSSIPTTGCDPRGTPDERNACDNPVGVLIYDSEDRDADGNSLCPVLAGNACVGDIVARGTSHKGAWIHLTPNAEPYKNLLIFVDRSLSPNIWFNGDFGKIELYGTVYDAKGKIEINGTADDTVAAQIIAYNIVVTGSSDGFTVKYNAEGIFHLKGAGLVQ